MLAAVDARKSETSIQASAEKGVSGSSGALPHASTIQNSFGGYDISNVQAHTDPAAQAATAAMGADAYATGNQIAFGKGGARLHTAAHEAAHVVQQRAGVSLSGGVGKSGDAYEQHADKVADAVVQGKSAEGLLEEMAGGSSMGAVSEPHESPLAHPELQRAEEKPGANGPSTSMSDAKPTQGSARRRVAAIQAGVLNRVQAHAASREPQEQVQKKSINVGTAEVRIDDSQSASEIAAIGTAVADALARVSEALSLVRSVDPANAELARRIEKWFGLPTSDGVLYEICVRSLIPPFQKMQTALSTYIPVEVEPEYYGEARTIAYVLPTPWSDIHLYKAWFDRPAEARARYFLHECAHKFASAVDVEYWDERKGQSNEKFKRLSFVEHARNADSFVMFAFDGAAA